MSSKLHDLATQAVLAFGATPRTLTTSLTGSPVDLITGDGRCFAIQQVGDLSGSGASLAGKIQESANAASWTDIAGATFTTVTGDDNLQCITFDRSQRYVRYIGTVAGTTPSIPMAVVLGQQAKQT